MAEQTVNVLITGASGLLGRSVYKYFTNEAFRAKFPMTAEFAKESKLKWNCLGLCYSRVSENLKKIDLTDFNAVDQLIEEYKVSMPFEIQTFYIVI